MKKLLTLVLAGGMAAFTACGPSAEDQAKEQKRKDDSIHAADSVKQAETAMKEKARQDSIMQAETAMKEKAHQDSIHMADSLAAAKKGGKPKTKKEAEKQEVKNVVKGRG